MKNSITKHLAVIALLAGTASLGWAAAVINLNNFDSDSQLADWGANGTTLSWDNSQDAGGSSTVGCMKVQFAAGGNPWGTQPQRNLGAQTFGSADYWSVSFDFKIDSTSALTADPAAPYGHVQVIPVDTGWQWLPGFGWNAITENYTNWQHLEMSFPQPYTNFNALVFQVGDGGFASDVIFYIDNIKVNPTPATFVYSQFTNAASADGWNWQSWSQPGASAWAATPDAGGANPAGSLQLDCNFNNPDSPVYQQVVFQKNFELDPNRFVYFDFDVKMDPSSHPMGNGQFPSLETIINVNGNWAWASLGNLSLTVTNTTQWTHVSYPMGGHGATNMHAITLKCAGGWDANWGPTNTVKLFVDNIKFWSPEVSPSLSLLPSGPGGLQVVCTAPTDDWQRQNIVTPSGNYGYSWMGAGQPVTYSFTITNFPDAKAHPGFEAHAYLINYETLPTPVALNETYPAVDWNASDIINVKMVNNANGGVDFSFNFKTNLPGANINQTLASIHADTALGTWAVTFNDNTSATLSGPGVSTNFTLAAEMADKFSGQMFLHFGTFKNQIRNNEAAATFSRIQVTGGFAAFDETFPGPGLNPDPQNAFWRLAADSAGIQWIPKGTAYWLTWTLPDTGFTVQSSSDLTGQWTSPNLTYVIEGSTSKTAAVPASSLPSPGAGFFRLIKAGP